MKDQTLILIPNPKDANAPAAILNLNKLSVKTEAELFYNYAISTGDGSVVKKGMFVGELKLMLELTDASKILQLDVFNADYHFTYNFTASGEIPIIQ